MKQRMFDEYELAVTCRLVVGKHNRETFEDRADLEEHLCVALDGVIMEKMCEWSGVGFDMAGTNLTITLLEDLQ